MTTVIFHDFPSLENSFLKFHDLPGCVGTLPVGRDKTSCGISQQCIHTRLISTNEDKVDITKNYTTDIYNITISDVRCTHLMRIGRYSGTLFSDTVPLCIHKYSCTVSDKSRPLACHNVAMTHGLGRQSCGPPKMT